MYHHEDNLDVLNSKLPLKDKLVSAHKTIKDKFPFIARIAITIYDPETRVLKTFMHSSGEDNPLENYQALLDNAPSLKEIIDKGRPRVVNNLVTFEGGNNTHSKRLGRQGYLASYTMPMFDSGEFFGFLFFNSYEKDVFSEKVLRDLDVFGHLISLMILSELSIIRMMSAAVKTTSQIVHVRDPETGSHLDRMSRYSRVIAKALTKKYELNDEYIEYVYMFAPLHDIGKIAIPDDILLKPGKLDEQETAIMQTHSSKGREIIDEMIKNFDLDGVDNINILRNIAECHHEAVNGSGYPAGISEDEIPLEARIVAVSDVFDALTSKRSYKNAWSNEDAIAMLEKMAGETLDVDCVNALIECRKDIESIQMQFKEDQYG